MTDRVRNYVINATNVHIKVNGHWLDQAVSVAAQKQSSHHMTYGYMDPDPRRPILGRSLVVGTIGIHFRAVDYFFRFLAQVNKAVPDRHVTYAQAVERMRQKVKEFKNDAEIMAYMSTLSLDSQEFEAFREAVEKNAMQEPENSLPGVSAQIPDAVGAEGFREGVRNFYQARGMKRGYLGHFIEIVYGDAQNETLGERIIGVTFTGLAKSPFENTAGVSADPAMEYYSFIGATIIPNDRNRVITTQR